MAVVVLRPGTIDELNDAQFVRRERDRKAAREDVLVEREQIGNRGAVEMEPDPVDLPVKPAEFVRIVRDMQRSGTSRDKRPAGVSQPLWRRVMTALEDLDGAVNGPNGFEFTDDLDALLEDISRW